MEQAAPPLAGPAEEEAVQDGELGMGGKLVHGEFFVVNTRAGGAAALSAQIFPGDALVKINKTDTRNLSMEEVQDMLSGVCGKKVNVFVRRLGGDPRPACVELECASPSSRNENV